MNYPVDLPNPRLDTATVSMSPSTRIQKYDLGFKINQSEKNTDTFDWSVIVKDNQFEQFETWYRWTLGGGFIPFTADWDYLNNITKTYEFIEQVSVQPLGAGVYKLTSTVRAGV